MTTSVSDNSEPIIDIIAGARPNFMKIAPIIHAFRTRRTDGGKLRHRLIHTGQHYDQRMSGDFFDQLNIPPPDINLEVGSGTQAEQTAAIMVGYERAIIAERPQACVVVGDVTSTMACAIAAQKLRVPVAHVEAGIRSGDWSMPEEINRMVTDSITNWFFTTSEHANANLQSAGIPDDRVFFVGNTMIDTLLANMGRLTKPAFFDELSLQKGNYLVVTMHRPANVDSTQLLAGTLQTVAECAGDVPVVFPVHPRTQKSLQDIANLPANLLLVEPQPYLEFAWLVQHAWAVVTDSGGITEEATVMKIPCLTLRDTTERPETVEMGTNELVGCHPQAIRHAFEKLSAGKWKKGATPPLWDGKTAERIVGHLERLLESPCGS